jgi:hypothetical protein
METKIKEGLIKLKPECSRFFVLKKAHPNNIGYDLCSRIDAVLEILV